MSPLGSMMKPEPVARCGSSGSSREASPGARRTRTCTSAGLRCSARSASSALTRWSSGAAAGWAASRPRTPRLSAPVGPAHPNENATASIRTTTAIGRDIIRPLLRATLLRVYESSLTRERVGLTAFRAPAPPAPSDPGGGAEGAAEAPFDLLARDFTNEVGELRNEELLERQAAGIRRSRERDDDPPRTDAELRARQHRGGADFRVGEHAEELAEAGQTLVEQRLDRLERGVARRDPGTTRHDHRLDPPVRARLAHDALNVDGLVAHDRRPDYLVAGAVEELTDERAARVRLGRLRVGDGEHPAADALRRVGLVLARGGRRVGHGAAYARSSNSTRWSTRTPDR